MSQTEPLAFYRTPQFKRIQLSLTAFVVLFVVSVLSALLIGRGILPLAGIIGIAVGTYFTSNQTIRLYPDRLTQKAFFGKAINCTFKDGVFSLERASSVEAWLMSFKKDKLLIKYKPKGNQRAIPLGSLLSDKDLQEIFEKIQEKKQVSV